jgi:hypothetical protein
MPTEHQRLFSLLRETNESIIRAILWQTSLALKTRVDLALNGAYAYVGLKHGL